MLVSSFLKDLNAKSDKHRSELQRKLSIQTGKCEGKEAGPAYSSSDETDESHDPSQPSCSYVRHPKRKTKSPHSKGPNAKKK